jgi:hypothetical protein
MIIKEKIKLGETNYYITIDCVYKKDTLSLRNYHRDYFDGGDLSYLIKEVEKKFKDSHLRYGYSHWFLNDVLYIYDNIPFISGAGDCYFDKEGMLYSSSYITKEELDTFIKENNIKMKDNSKFRLGDSRTWDVK